MSETAQEKRATLIAMATTAAEQTTKMERKRDQQKQSAKRKTKTVDRQHLVKKKPTTTTKAVKEPLPRVGQYMVKHVGSDRYAATVQSVDEKTGLVELANGKGLLKKNPTKAGYASVNRYTLCFDYDGRAHHRPSWIPVEGVATTYLDPGF